MWQPTLLTWKQISIETGSKIQHIAQGPMPAVKTVPITVQAFWRGTSVRMTSGRRKADMRLRLRQAAVRAAKSPHRQLGSQTRAALQQLVAAKHLPQAFPAMATLSMCSQYSKGCCTMIAGGVKQHYLT